jgi:hypothetical protein
MDHMAAELGSDFKDMGMQSKLEEDLKPVFIPISIEIESADNIDHFDER